MNSKDSTCILIKRTTHKALVDWINNHFEAPKDITFDTAVQVLIDLGKPKDNIGEL